MYIRRHVKYPLFLSNLKETRIFSTDLKKNSDFNFHFNPSSGRRVVRCGQMDGWTGKAKIMFTFCNFAFASTNNKTVPTFSAVIVKILNIFL
jgi:hypothetical protein